MSVNIAFYIGEVVLQKVDGGYRIQRNVNEAGKILGVSRQDFETAYADLLIKKLSGVMDDASHPLYDRLSGQLISKSGRIRLPSAATNWYISSFVPQAIRNNSIYKKGWCRHWYTVVLTLFRVLLYMTSHVCNFPSWIWWSFTWLDLTWLE